MISNHRVALEITQDFIDHISIYHEDIQEEIASLVYIYIKKRLNNRRKKEVNRNGTISGK